MRVAKGGLRDRAAYNEYMRNYMKRRRRENVETRRKNQRAK